MTPNPQFFQDLAYIFIGAMAGGILAWRLRQPIIIGYVLAGILISPFTPGPSVSDVHILELFAEIGVILLMFSIGLEFSLKELLREKWVALVGGPLGIFLSIGMSLGIGHLLGWTNAQGITVGITICVASTMVLTRMLLDQGQLRTRPGRVMVAITLMEDIAVVILIVLIPTLGNLEAAKLQTLAQDLGRAALILVPALFVGVKVVPRVLKWVAQTQSRELFFIVVLSICLGTAALTQSVGLSLAFGAFVAGLIISESDYAHEALAQLFSLRDAFVALFFVTIGLLIDPRALFSNMPLLATMVALVIVGKFVVWTVVVRLFRYPLSTAVTVAVGLTQIGEFSFVLVQVARNAGIVGSDVYNATLAASLVTILLNAALVRYVPAALARKRLAKQMAAETHDGVKELGGGRHVVICGYGRIGSSIGAALDTFRVPYVVIDIDPDVTGAMQERGISYKFGDSSHPYILERAGVEEASLVVVTVPDPERARLTIANVRKANPTVPIMGRAHERRDHEVLVHSGATEIIRPEMEASATMIRHSGAYLGLPDDQIRAYLKGFRQTMESLQRRPIPSDSPYIEVREIALNESPLAGRSLRDSRIREAFGVTIVSIKRPDGEILMNPHPDTVLGSGDRLTVMGLAEQLSAFKDQASA